MLGCMDSSCAGFAPCNNCAYVVVQHTMLTTMIEELLCFRHTSLSWICSGSGCPLPEL